LAAGQHCLILDLVLLCGCVVLQRGRPCKKTKVRPIMQNSTKTDLNAAPSLCFEFSMAHAHVHSCARTAA
jgi:hypothetical protein